MRIVFASIFSVALLPFAVQGQDIIKDGKLTQTLKITQTQGGFAGNTGTQFTIAPDGAWTAEGVFNKKITPKNKGKLSDKDLAALAAILEKNEVTKLPEKSGKPPGANPHTIIIEFGDKKATLVGQTPPKVDATNPTGSVESRFAGIWKGVVGLLDSPEKKSSRSIDDFQKRLDKTATPAATVAAFGEPTRRLGSGLIIFEYDLEDGTKVRLGFPGFAPITYAHHVQKNGEFTAMQLK